MACDRFAKGVLQKSHLAPFQNITPCLSCCLRYYSTAASSDRSDTRITYQGIVLPKHNVDTLNLIVENLTPLFCHGCNLFSEHSLLEAHNFLKFLPLVSAITSANNTILLDHFIHLYNHTCLIMPQTNVMCM